MGGAVAAARAALETGFSAQLAGGTHHAHANFGSGYCVFNDFAIAALKALNEGWAERVAIIDLDVHQGDGNAAILGERRDVLILDVYCEKNFPFEKIRPHLPAPLEAGLSDGVYLSLLADLLSEVIAFRPGLVLYQAGVDPLGCDRLGHLDLSYEGLASRDRMVFEACKRAGIPLSLAIGGGYANPISLSVEAYANTFRVAKEVFGF
jgi:acetoin utilization deacetylase AcuC-like enzyme